MALPPALTELADAYPLPSNATFKAGITKLLNYATGLLGSTGNQAEARALLGIAPAGQCRLSKSGSNLLLSRYQGSFLTINNVNCLIPSAGVTLAPTGLTVGTTYYIYATATAGVVSGLEASTTGHSTDTTTGMEIKTGDATRTLVGMVRPITGPAFADTTAQRFVASWFNRRPNSATNFGTGVGVGGTSFGELSTAARCELLSWAGDGMQMALAATVSQNSMNATAETGIGVDSTTVSSTEESRWQAYVNGALGSLSLSQPTIPALAEGYHYFTPLGRVNVGGTIATFAKFSTTVYLMN